MKQKNKLITVALLLLLSGDFSVEVERTGFVTSVKVTKDQTSPIDFFQELLN